MASSTQGCVVSGPAGASGTGAAAGAGAAGVALFPSGTVEMAVDGGGGGTPGGGGGPCHQLRLLVLQARSHQ